MKNKRRHRNTVMSLMIFIGTINYIDRGALAYVAQPIIEMFNLNPKDWGWILGFFGYGYLIGSLFGGAIADKKGSKFVWLLAVTVWSIAAIFTAFAGDIGNHLLGGSAVAGFAICRIIFGLAEGPVYATMNKTIADWVPGKDRAVFVGFGLIGVPLGALLTAPIAVAFLAISTWQVMYMYIVLEVIGLIWTVIWNKVFISRPEDNPRVSTEELAEIRSDEKVEKSEGRVNTPWYHFFKNPTLILNAISFFAFNYVIFLLLTWTPKYLQDEFNFQISSLWYLGMVPWIGAVVTTAYGGKISTILLETTGSFRIARSGLIMMCLLLTAACFFIIPYMINVTAAILILMMVGNALNSLPMSVYWANVIDAASSKAGTFSGITHFIINTASIVCKDGIFTNEIRRGYNVKKQSGCRYGGSFRNRRGNCTSVSG